MLGEPGCKILMLNFPTNPTGGTADRQNPRNRSAKFAVEKDLIVISDEIYAELISKGEHASIAALPGTEGKNDSTPWFLQGVCHDGFPERGLQVGPGPGWLKQR